MPTLRLAFVGPAESITMRRWVEWFTARGHETTVVTVEPAQDPAFRQIDLSLPWLPRKLGRLIAATRVTGAIQGLRPDVVHVHYARGLAWGLAWRPVHPYVVTVWGSDILEEQGAFRDWPGRALTPRVLAGADMVTTHSAYLEGKARSLLPGEPHFERVGWGVDLQQFRPGLDVASLRRRWRIDENRQVIFSPRLAQPFYRHERVIDALSAVSEKVGDAVLVISEHCADPSYLENLRNRVTALKLDDKVRFVGSIPHVEMPLWLNLADAVVMVPRSDGMPNTLLEAMACGAVPVLTRLPQYSELVRHGVNGLLVDPEGDLAGALVQVLSDRFLRKDMAARNRQRVSQAADQQVEMARMEQLYVELSSIEGRRR